MADCILSKIDVNPYENGILDGPAFKSFLMEALANDSTWESWSDFLSKSFDKCLDFGRSKSEDFKVAFALKPAFKDEKICHPISGAVISCIDAEFYTSCPTSMWKKNDGECEKIKNFAKICQKMPPIRPS